MEKIKCHECPECKCEEYHSQGDSRICVSCKQEWYATVNYEKYRSPSYHYEVFSQLGRSLPTRDKNGDANRFDKRSIKRRIRKLKKSGLTVTAFITKPSEKRTMIYSNHAPNAMNAINI